VEQEYVQYATKKNCHSINELHRDIISPLGGGERHQVVEACYEAEVDFS